MNPSDASDALIIVLGPLSRLGSACMRIAEARSFDVCAVARHAADAERIRRQWPRARVFVAGDPVSALPSGHQRIVLCTCAAGLIHPRKADWAMDVSEADRDIRLHLQILASFESVPVHVIFVSTVLALSPRGTAHYAGWKNVMLGTLAEAVAEHPRGRLSVLYPGRLVERRTPAHLLSLTHGTFEQLAARIGRIAATDRPCRRVVGLDAYLWLMLRGLPTWLATLTLAKQD
jgi:hypothetical protein